MKPERAGSQSPVSKQASPCQAATPAANATGATKGSCRSWFRLFVFLLPLIVLGGTELCLRMGGYGYPTSFFLKSRQDGQEVLVENPRFGWRFFPPAVARSPQPLRFFAQKPAGTIRIFVLGESAAMGDPEPSYGLARQLERILQARHPGQKVEVLNVAMTAINSHVIREIARDCGGCDGDFWVLYAGNNEVIGPFGAGTVFGRQAAGLAAVRATLALRSTRLGQLLSRALAGSHEPANWEGMELFLRQQVSRDDPRLVRVYESFAANFSAIADLGRQHGAKVLACTMPVNLRDCPPFASRHRPTLSAAELAEWEKHFGVGQKAEAEHHWAEALTAYEAAARIDDRHAELAFRRATCELALGQTKPALEQFRLARDLDALRFRADSRLNESVRQSAAARHLLLVDTEEACALRSVNGVLGEELFYDHVHLNFAGNYTVAAVIARAIEEQLAGAAGAGLGGVLTEAEVARQLAFTEFDRQRVGEEMRLRLQQPPFTAQSNFKERDERWRKLLDPPQPQPGSFSEEYRTALKGTPDDWVLHANFGRLLEVAEDNTWAAAQWREVARLMPHLADPWFQLGNLAQGAGSSAEAESWYRQALQRKPDSAETLNGLGLALVDQGHAQEATRAFLAALRLEPAYAAARVNLAGVLARAGDPAGALGHYQTVLRQDTNNVAARINLAKLLVALDQVDEALGLYNEALRLSPSNAVAHLNLGNALAGKGRHAEAAAEYAAAVQWQPGFVEARYNLALEVTRLGRVTEALSQFAEVVRLKPDHAEARYNYGIALAKERRYAEAVQQFEETLKLQPSHTAARSALERASDLMRR